MTQAWGRPGAQSARADGGVERVLRRLRALKLAGYKRIG